MLRHNVKRLLQCGIDFYCTHPQEIPQFPDALSAASLNNENPIMATAGAIVIGVM